jgi:hypothetical protein
MGIIKDAMFVKLQQGGKNADKSTYLHSYGKRSKMAVTI